MVFYNCNATRWVNFEYRVWAMHIENKQVQFLFYSLQYIFNESNLERIFGNSTRVQLGSAIGTGILCY